jgi:Ca-activated chloride channel homolog
MFLRNSIAFSIFLMAWAAGAPTVVAPNGFDIKPGQSVYIIGVRSSSFIEAAIYEKWERDYVTAVCGDVHPDANHLGGGSPTVPVWATLEGSGLDAGPMISTDIRLRDKIVEEFRKQKKFTIAAAPESADFVFFAFSHYPWGSGVIGPDPKRGPYGPAVTVATFFRAYEDSPYLSTACHAMGFAMPVSTYRKIRKDVATLSGASPWQAYVSNSAIPDRCKEPGEAGAARVLVKEFHEYAQKQGKASNMQPANGSAGVKNEKGRPVLVPKDQATATSSATTNIPGSGVFRVETSLVNVPVAVLDRDSRFLSDIAHSEFHVFEEGVEQEIDRFETMDAPFHVALILDTSASMRLQRDDAKRAAFVFIQQLQPQDRVLVVAANSEIYVGAEFTGDRDHWQRAVNEAPNGLGTRLYDALALVMEEKLKEVKSRKAVILFSDGVDTESRLVNQRRSLELAEESGALVYTIGYRTENDIVEAQLSPNIPGLGRVDTKTERSNVVMTGTEAYRLAREYMSELPARTGAREYQPKSVSDLSLAFSDIAQDLRHQYEISYYPKSAAGDRSYRKIRIQVDRPGVVVRAKPGYRSSGQLPPGK